MRGEYYSSASMSTYVRWVMKDKLNMKDREIRDYLGVCMTLSDIEYVWIHPMDENRAMDGLELRSDFEYETGEYLDKSSGLLPKCTFFEMLAALSIKCENQLMRNLSIGDRTSKWFFEFLDNLGVENDISDLEIDKIVEDFMVGKGKNTMFPLKKRGINQKNEQIWKQMGAYLNENYLNEDPDLVLFN